MAGAGYGYVLTPGGRRIYISGNTDDIPETQALAGINVAFVWCDGAYNMSITRAAAAARQFRPGGGDPPYRTASITQFKQLVGADLGIEARLRKREQAPARSWEPERARGSEHDHTYSRNAARRLPEPGGWRRLRTVHTNRPVSR